MFMDSNYHNAFKNNQEDILKQKTTPAQKAAQLSEKDTTAGNAQRYALFVETEAFRSLQKHISSIEDEEFKKFCTPAIEFWTAARSQMGSVHVTAGQYLKKAKNSKERQKLRFIHNTLLASTTKKRVIEIDNIIASVKNEDRDAFAKHSRAFITLMKTTSDASLASLDLLTDTYTAGRPKSEAIAKEYKNFSAKVTKLFTKAPNYPMRRITRKNTDRRKTL